MAVQFFFPDKTEIKPDLSEVARYLGYKKTNPPTPEIQKLIEQCAEEMGKILTPKATYDQFTINSEFGMRNAELDNQDNTDFLGKKSDGLIEFSDVSFYSKDLTKNLQNCSEIVILAATIGSQVDMLIKKTEHLDSVKAAIFQATGAMYIEEVVNLLNEKINREAAEKGFKTHPRYSPGYGDVNIEVQKEFFRILPCTKIGLTLMDTLIMAPEKSVTAFIGLQPV